MATDLGAAGLVCWRAIFAFWVTLAVLCQLDLQAATLTLHPHCIFTFYKFGGGGRAKSACASVWACKMCLCLRVGVPAAA